MRILFLSLMLLLTWSPQISLAQDAPSEEPQMYLIIKQDGNKIIGELLHQDAREVIIRTKELGEVIIPKHVIESMRPLNEEEMNEKGDYIPNEVFSTRYFLTTNGLPVKKGENYIQWNLFGPDFQFAVTDRLGMGFMTSWLSVPVVGTIKYSIPLGKKNHLAIGGLIGSGTWTRPDWFMALPFAAFTHGNRRANINFSIGYGLISSNPRRSFLGPRLGRSSDGAPLFSVAGMIKVASTMSLVFDSFITTYETSETIAPGLGVVPVVQRRRTNVVIFSPGIRWQSKPKSAIQLGIGGVIIDGQSLPSPVPVVQWYRQL